MSMANLEERKPNAQQSAGEKKTEQDEIDSFNQNTDYDASNSLHDDGGTEDNNPFSTHNLAIQTFISTARVYDVLIALLKEANPDVARDILELHQAGHLLASAPSFSGTFLTDEMNQND